MLVHCLLIQRFYSVAFTPLKLLKLKTAPRCGGLLCIVHQGVKSALEKNSREGNGRGWSAGQVQEWELYI